MWKMKTEQGDCSPCYAREQEESASGRPGARARARAVIVKNFYTFPETAEGILQTFT
jgi:hypothetical protein